MTQEADWNMPLGEFMHKMDRVFDTASEGVERLVIASVVNGETFVYAPHDLNPGELSRLMDTVSGVPNQPKTPLHSFRVDDELWDAAKKRAEERGETLADALRKFLRRYTK